MKLVQMMVLDDPFVLDLYLVSSSTNRLLEATVVGAPCVRVFYQKNIYDIFETFLDNDGEEKDISQFFHNNERERSENIEELMNVGFQTQFESIGEPEPHEN